MMLPRINLKNKLLKEKSKQTSDEQILHAVESIFQTVDQDNAKILQNLNVDHLEAEHIFHIDQIEKICVNYRLRFLDSKLFKGELPYEAISKIKDLERRHDTSLKGFKIMAPSKLFKLENADDPLIFAPIGNGYYYLIHKWGNDLSPFRRIMMWPFKTFENFMFTILIAALVCTSLVPKGFFMNEDNLGTEFFLLFIFMFKWIGGISLYYGFAKGKNFNTSIWQSKYYNA